MKVQWRQIVGRMPAGWFTLETLPVLEDLCRNIAYRHSMAVELDKVDLAKLVTQEEQKGYEFQLRRYQRTASLVASLATRLRLTTQSQRTRPRPTKNLEGTSGASPVKPWDDDDDAARVN
jgi:hypothetical protein